MTYSELKNTSLPWKVAESTSDFIVDKDNHEVATCFCGASEEDAINAQLIVTAVNSHQLLVGVLEGIKLKAADDNTHPEDRNFEIEKIAEAALKAARGE